jgi:hypothetical protein
MTHPWITIRLLFRSILLDAIDRGAPVSDTAIELSKTLSQLGRESLLIRQSGASWEGDAGDATWIRHESSGNTSGKRVAAFAGTAGHGYIYGKTLTPSSKKPGNVLESM